MILIEWIFGCMFLFDLLFETTCLLGAVMICLAIAKIAKAVMKGHDPESKGE